MQCESEKNLPPPPWEFPPTPKPIILPETHRQGSEQRRETRVRESDRQSKVMRFSFPFSPRTIRGHYVIAVGFHVFTNGTLPACTQRLSQQWDNRTSVSGRNDPASHTSGKPTAMSLGELGV